MSLVRPSEDKKRLRSTIGRELESVTDMQALAVGVAIDRFLCASQGWLEASELAVFASLPREVDTRPLMRSAAADGKTLLLPRIIDGGVLEFAAVSDLDALVPGRFGIREPDPRLPVRPLSRSALVLVPGVAFDRRGGRLGRGAGYYDRVLMPVRAGAEGPLCLGIAFALQVVESIPMTPLDVRLDGLVTEDEFLLIS